MYRGVGPYYHTYQSSLFNPKPGSWSREVATRGPYASGRAKYVLARTEVAQWRQTVEGVKLRRPGGRWWREGEIF